MARQTNDLWSVRGKSLRIAGKPLRVRNGNRVLCRGFGTIVLYITYPFNKTFHSYRSVKYGKDTFTVNDLYREVKAAYSELYRTPAQSGVWGHSIRDLVLEGFRQYRPGKFSLDIGS